MLKKIRDLKNGTSTHTIIYLFVSFIVFFISTFFIYLRYKENIYFIDPYYLICIDIISIGLFFMALVSIIKK